MTDVSLDDAARIRRYLLGELPGPDVDELEERYFSDTAFFEQVDAAADELCDAYVQGSLTAGERSRVEQLARSHTWRFRVRFANALASESGAARTQAVAKRGEAPASGGAPRLTVRDIARMLWQQSGPTKLLAAAAISFLALGWPSSWLVLRSRGELERSLASTEGQLAAEQLQRRQLEGRLAGQSTVDFALVPGVLRGATESLLIPSNAAFVRLQLGVETASPGTRRTAVIETPDGNVVWSGAARDSTLGDGSLLPTVSIPARLLPDGEYVVQLLTVRDSARADVIARYGMRIARR